MEVPFLEVFAKVNRASLCHMAGKDASSVFVNEVLNSDWLGEEAAQV